jgi:hypothetical protein
LISQGLMWPLAIVKGKVLSQPALDLSQGLIVLDRTYALTSII